MKKKPDPSKKGKAAKPDKKPKPKDSAQLSDEELDKVSGGRLPYNRGVS